MKYAKELTDSIYLKGDFSATFNFYKRLKRSGESGIMQYNLFSYNCKHAVIEGLLTSINYTEHPFVYRVLVTSYNKIIPNFSFSYMKNFLYL